MDCFGLTIIVGSLWFLFVVMERWLEKIHEELRETNKHLTDLKLDVFNLKEKK